MHEDKGIPSLAQEVKRWMPLARTFEGDMKRAFLLAVISMAGLPSCRIPYFDTYQTVHKREDFADRLTLLSEGMPAARVLALVGKPDDIRTHSDPGGISSPGTSEIWCYGSDGHLTFPTLGQIHLDSNCRVQFIFGARKAIFTEGMDEAQIRGLLCTIDRLPPVSGCQYDPLPMIEVVNSLQALGKHKAVRILREYVRVASPLHSQAVNGGLSLALRILFEVPNDPGYFPRLRYLLTPIGKEPEDPKSLPRFPMHLENDIPILLIAGYVKSGVPQDLEQELQYFESHCPLRARPLRPSVQPFLVSERTKGLWSSIAMDTWQSYHQAMIRSQLLRLVDSVFRVQTVDSGGLLIEPDKQADERWAAYCAQLSTQLIRWETGEHKYVFGDGTSLPKRERPLFRREVWTTKLGGTTVVLAMERICNKYISISLDMEGHGQLLLPDGSLRILAEGTEVNPLAEFPHMKPTTRKQLSSEFGSWTHSERVSVQWERGKGLIAELDSDGILFRSQVFRP